MIPQGALVFNSEDHLDLRGTLRKLFDTELFIKKHKNTKHPLQNIEEKSSSTKKTAI